MSSNFKILYAMVAMIFAMLSVNISDSIIITLKNCCIIYCFNFESSQEVFSLFCFNIYKMIGSEYSTNINMPFKISIGTEIRSPKMLKFLPHHCKTKKSVIMQLKNYLSQ